MKFDEYSIAHELKKSLAELGFKKPTDIQYKAIPSIMKGEDVLAIAQTGTGKTAAFAIPILDKIIKQSFKTRYKGIKCVVIVPTHELAIQITEVFNQLAKYSKIKTHAIYGSTDQDPQIAKLLEGFDILVATPGRVFDLRHQGHLRLDKVHTLVLDEADHMLALGFVKDITDLLYYLPERRQTLFFSATLNEEIKKIAYKLVDGKAIRIQLSPKDPVSKNIDHSVAYVEMDHKRFFLERLLKENPEHKVLVFVRTKVRAERVVAAMQRVNVESLTIHGDKEQEDRIAALNAFKTGQTRLLIATDVSARGIDIADVDFVLNYDLPDEPENYVHRIGRTGRGKKRGKAFSFCSKDEKPLLKAIENYTGYAIRELEIEHLDYETTLNFSDDLPSVGWKDIKKEIAEAENFKKKKKKKK